MIGAGVEMSATVVLMIGVSALLCWLYVRGRHGSP